jgi:integrase
MALLASELRDFRWHQVDFKTTNLHVRRVKSGTPSTHPLQGDEMRALRRPQKEQQPSSPVVFTSERGRAVRPSPRQALPGCSSGPRQRAKITIKVHPHIQHTVRYTEPAPTRFKNFWKS